MHRGFWEISKKMGKIRHNNGISNKNNLIRKRIFPLCLTGFVVAAGIWYQKYPAHALELSGLGPASETGYRQELQVEIAGAVVRPGVYALPNSALVKDGISLAGGFTNAADEGRLSMEDALFDRERLYVPVRGEDVVSLVGYRDLAADAVSGPLDLNAATKEELESLPGIGETIAENIVEYRRQHGRFESVEDLLQVDRIGKSLLEKLADRITVK